MDEIKILWPEDMEDIKNGNEPQKINLVQTDSSPNKPQPASITINDAIPIVMPEKPKLKKKKLCGKPIIGEDGMSTKCKSQFDDCDKHVCRSCQIEKLTSAQCVHKNVHNVNAPPQLYNREYAAEHLFNLQFTAYAMMERFCNMADTSVKMDGLTQIVLEKQQIYKNLFAGVYDELGYEYIEKILSPSMLWAINTGGDIVECSMANKVLQEKKI